jgi:hypothetical protein
VLNTSFKWLNISCHVLSNTPKSRWEGNIKISLQEVGCGGIDWIELAQDRDRRRELVNAAMNLRVPKNEGNFLTG